ncbi:MAG: ABC transporter permease [Bacteroidetes bacterium]|nr:ABC transporter permease [Bacteroidota bacterium]
MVLAASVAHKYFGDADPLGKTMTLENEQTLTVTGILGELPRHAHLRFDIMLSFTTLEAMVTSNLHENWSWNSYYTYLLLPLFNGLTGKVLTLGALWTGGTVFVVLGLVLLVGEVAGLYPALVLSDFRPAVVLKGAFRASKHGGRRLYRQLRHRGRGRTRVFQRFCHRRGGGVCYQRDGGQTLWLEVARGRHRQTIRARQSRGRNRRSGEGFQLPHRYILADISSGGPGGPSGCLVDGELPIDPSRAGQPGRESALRVSACC